MPKLAKKKKTAVNATAFHGKGKDGSTIVGIGNLRVVIIQEGNEWFAQALEIDYAAQGTSLTNVKKAFEKGLAATVHENLRVYGTIEKLLKPAPPEVWRDMLFGVAVSGKHFRRFSQISLHSKLQQTLPFAAIDYLELPKAA